MGAYILLLFAVCMRTTSMLATSLPPSKPVHIEVRYRSGINRLLYFWMTDLYRKEERKVKSEFRGNGVASLDFELYHPLYDEIVSGSNRRLPFYVEPGDSLIIYVGKNGWVETYERKDGTAVKYENLLRHDISNNLFYTKEDFDADKEQRLFPAFVERVKQKMEVALDSVAHCADKYGFTAEERNLARCNVQLQFALWIFEYAPYKTSELLAYADQHESGWQSKPVEDMEIEAIQNLQNYGFMKEMPLSDSTMLASKFFPAFVQSYEHAQVLNYDQYLYAGTSVEDIARMDSAFVAKDLAITYHDHPSLFMEVALARRHALPQQMEDDGSIKLPEVQVMGTNLDQFYRVFGPPKEYNPEEVVRTAWAHDVNLKGPISSFLNRKKIKNYKRAKKLVEQLGADDAVLDSLKAR
ncbi:MAG: hypothetical protein IJ693_00455 [Bacteroidaceae bacterium]|nr:hypothetical protein [Bacteroidaceae bacterium]